MKKYISTLFIYPFLLFFKILLHIIPLRERLSYQYIKGKGIEIGALNRPLMVFHGAEVRYVDRFPCAELLKHYPELSGTPLQEPDILDNGEILEKIETASCNFVIANHFLEHCEDPIQAIESFSRVLESGGILFLAVPDKEQTFDKNRHVTPWKHLVEDHGSGPELSRFHHYEDFVKHVLDPHESEISRIAMDLCDKSYSIHFHVWDVQNFLIFLGNVGGIIPLKVVSLIHHKDEIITIMEKK